MQVNWQDTDGIMFDRKLLVITRLPHRHVGKGDDYGKEEGNE